MLKETACKREVGTEWGQLEAAEKAPAADDRKGLDFLEPAKRIELFTC